MLVVTIKIHKQKLYKFNLVADTHRKKVVGFCLVGSLALYTLAQTTQVTSLDIKVQNKKFFIFVNFTLKIQKRKVKKCYFKKIKKGSDESHRQ